MILGDNGRNGSLSSANHSPAETILACDWIELSLVRLLIGDKNLERDLVLALDWLK